MIQITHAPEGKSIMTMLVVLIVCLVTIAALYYLSHIGVTKQSTAMPIISIASLISIICSVFFIMKIGGSLLWYIAPQYSRFNRIDGDLTSIALSKSGSHKVVVLPRDEITLIAIRNVSIFSSVTKTNRTVQIMEISTKGKTYKSTSTDKYYLNNPTEISDEWKAILKTINLKTSSPKPVS